MDLLSHLDRLFEYDRWANARVNDSLLSARKALESGGAAAEAPSLIKAVQIWSHVQWARRLWLSRLGAGPEPSRDQGIFPNWPLEHAIEECQVLDRLWHEFVSSLRDSGKLDAFAVYMSIEGQTYSTRVGDVLAHVVNHSTYHRGQIARLVAECGGQVAVTDFVVYARSLT